jgi:antirestriction protein ArdC
MSEEAKEKKVNPRREELMKLSQDARDLRESLAEQAATPAEALKWMSQTLNYMLMNYIYEKGENTQFFTFHQWKQQGATIRKGEKAFAIWGQPLDKQRRQQAEAKGQEPDSEDVDYQYFPICYLFGDKQVIKPEDRAPEERPEPEPERPEMEPVEMDEYL